MIMATTLYSGTPDLYACLLFLPLNTCPVLPVMTVNIYSSVNYHPTVIDPLTVHYGYYTIHVGQYLQLCEYQLSKSIVHEIKFGDIAVM